MWLCGILRFAQRNVAPEISLEAEQLEFDGLGGAAAPAGCPDLAPLDACVCVCVCVLIFEATPSFGGFF